MPRAGVANLLALIDWPRTRRGRPLYPDLLYLTYDSFLSFLVPLYTADCAIVPLPHWRSGIMGSVGSASLPVPLAWILGGAAGLVVGPGLWPWWQNTDLEWPGIQDLVLRHDGSWGQSGILVQGRDPHMA